MIGLTAARPSPASPAGYSSPIRGSDIPWSAIEGLDDRMRALHADGASADETACVLACEFADAFARHRVSPPSRNAVIGRRNRLGIVGQVTRPTRRFVAAAAPPELIFPPPQPDAPKPADLRISLLELTEDRCKWPLGDPAKAGFGFCGGPQAQVAPGSPAGTARPPYCEGHCRIAYTPRGSGKAGGATLPVGVRGFR